MINVTEVFKAKVKDIAGSKLVVNDQFIRYPIEKGQFFNFRFDWNGDYNPFIEQKSDFDRMLEATYRLDFPLFRLVRWGCIGVTDPKAEKIFRYQIKFKKFEPVKRKEITVLNENTKPVIIGDEPDSEPEPELKIEKTTPEPVTIPSDKILDKMNKKIKKSKPATRFAMEVSNNGKDSINS